MDKAAKEKYLDDLATMDELDYAQARKKASDVLRINMGVLDKLVAKRRKKMTVDASPMFLKPVEPWPDTVDGAALLDDLWSMLKRHVVLPKFAGDAIVMHAHAHDAARHSPILFASSPTKRCGKTILLETISRLVPKPLSAANITSATVFRAIDEWSPTMLIDESDTFISDKSELRGVLNSGHNESQAFVVPTADSEED